jgi:hypothetical protein
LLIVIINYVLPTVKLLSESTAKLEQDQRCSTCDKASSFVETLVLGLAIIGHDRGISDAITNYKLVIRGNSFMSSHWGWYFGRQKPTFQFFLLKHMPKYGTISKTRNLLLKQACTYLQGHYFIWHLALPFTHVTSPCVIAGSAALFSLPVCRE